MRGRVVVFVLRGRRGPDLVKKGGRVEGQLLGSFCLWVLFGRGVGPAYRKNISCGSRDYSFFYVVVWAGNSITSIFGNVGRNFS